MSTYTMQLRTVIEQATQNDSTLSIKQRIEKGRANLFNFDYPIFDEDYKTVFETNFIRKFFMREIGFETESLFQFQLETWLLINMPYFNKLFESELLEYDVLTNSKMEQTYNKQNDKTQNDVRDKSQNDVHDKSQHDVRDKSQNDERDKTQNFLNTDNINQSSNQVSNVSGSSDGTNEANSDTTNKQNSTGMMKDDNFTRDLESQTPDSRLSITAKDGEGLIEYANEIKEKNQNNEKTTENNVEGSDNTTSSGKFKNNSSEDGTVTVTDKGDNVSYGDSDENETLTSRIGETVTSNSDETVTSKVDETLTSKINDVEDFIQHRVGKIGVVSYPKLVQEYRGALLRIERQIFDEMNELFMLVY